MAAVRKHKTDQACGVNRIPSSLLKGASIQYFEEVRQLISDIIVKGEVPEHLLRGR